METDRVREAEHELAHNLANQKRQSLTTEQRLGQSLRLETQRNAALETENKDLRARLAAMSVLLQQLT